MLTVSSFYAGCPSRLVSGLLALTVTVTAALTLLLIWPVGAGATLGMGLSALSTMHSIYKDSIVQGRGVAAANEKRARTPAQKKIDSQLLYALYRKRGEAQAKGVPSGELGVKFDEKGRAIVSIRARVTKTVLAKIKSMGGRIISSSVRYNDIRAHLPLEKLEPARRPPARSRNTTAFALKQAWTSWNSSPTYPKSFTSSQCKNSDAIRSTAAMFAAVVLS